MCSAPKIPPAPKIEPPPPPPPPAAAAPTAPLIKTVSEKIRGKGSKKRGTAALRNDLNIPGSGRGLNIPRS